MKSSEILATLTFLGVCFLIGLGLAIMSNVNSMRDNYDAQKAKYCLEHHYTKEVEGTRTIYTENCK